MEFLVRVEPRLPPNTDELTEVRERERLRVEELKAAGILKRLWRVPGRMTAILIYEAPDANALHEIISTLPMWSYMDVTVEVLADHPLA